MNKRSNWLPWSLRRCWRSSWCRRRQTRSSRQRKPAATGRRARTGAVRHEQATGFAGAAQACTPADAVPSVARRQGSAAESAASGAGSRCAAAARLRLRLRLRLPGSLRPACSAPTSEKVTFAADTFFDFDKAVLKPEGKAKLDDLTGKLKDITLEVIIAVGHTDSIGADAYNQNLSVRRAEAVKAYLVSKGIEANRVYTEGKGEKQPVADNKTARRSREEPSRGNRSGGYPPASLICDPRGLIRSPAVKAPLGGAFSCRRPTSNPGQTPSSGNATDADRFRDHAPQQRRPAELEKFQALAARWWDPHSEFRPLHEINPLRLRLDRRARCRSPASACSTSAAAAASWPKRWRCAARRSPASTWPRSRCKSPNCTALESGADVSYERIAAEELAAREPGSFDVVTCMEMLEHVPDPESSGRRLRAPGRARWLACSFRRSTATPRRSCSRSSAPSTC